MSCCILLFLEKKKSYHMHFHCLILSGKCSAIIHFFVKLAELDFFVQIVAISRCKLGPLITLVLQLLPFSVRTPVCISSLLNKSIFACVLLYDKLPLLVGFLLIQNDNCHIFPCPHARPPSSPPAPNQNRLLTTPLCPPPKFLSDPLLLNLLLACSPLRPPGLEPGSARCGLDTH